MEDNGFYVWLARVLRIYVQPLTTTWLVRMLPDLEVCQ